MNMSEFNWFSLLGHFMILSLLAIGGALSTASEMHRRLVDQAGWLSDGEFNASIALAQAAPGPNVLFVALVGWQVGLNAAGGVLQGPIPWLSAFLGSVLAMGGMMIPSCALTFVAARWGHQNRDRRGIRAFKQGMAPVVVALLVATGWIIAAGQASQPSYLRLWAVSLIAMLLVWKTRVHLLWLLLGGGLAGALGWL